MVEQSAIEWTDSTWNPTTGCTKVSRGCDHCYAETLANRILRKSYTARLPIIDTEENRVDPFAVRMWPERNRLDGARRVLEGHRENDDRRPARGIGVLQALHVGAGHRRADLLRGLLGPLELARSDHDRPPGLGEAQRQAQALVPRSSQDGNRVLVHVRRCPRCPRASSIERRTYLIDPSRRPARRAVTLLAVPDDDAFTPASIGQRGPRELAIRWSDGRQSVYAVRALRLACGCAHCVDEWSGAQRLDPASVPDDVRPLRIESVGRYAIQIHWSDGHASGIYPFRRLRELDDDA